MQKFIPVVDEIFPESADLFSPEWLTEVLTRCEVLTGQTVDRVEVEHIDTKLGIMGHYARIQIDGDRLPDDAPRTLFAKYLAMLVGTVSD